jgi:hypothetical protein
MPNQNRVCDENVEKTKKYTVRNFCFFTVSRVQGAVVSRNFSPIKDYSSTVKKTGKIASKGENMSGKNRNKSSHNQ